jgi:hypothetical protein
VLAGAGYRVHDADREVGRATGLLRDADAYRGLVRGRVAGNGRADQGNRAAEVHRGVPSRYHVTDSRGAHGGHVPGIVPGPAAAQRRHRRSFRRIAQVRRLHAARRTLRAVRRVPFRGPGCMGRQAVRLHRHVLHRRGRYGILPARSSPRDLLRRLIAGRGAGGGQAGGCVPDLRRAARASRGEDRLGARARCGAGQAVALRDEDPRHHQGSRGAGLGRGGAAGRVRRHR